MQTELLTSPQVDISWFRAAIRECVAYGEHGVLIERVNGQTHCFNCGGKL